jgi:Cu+-exporting ATPase
LQRLHPQGRSTPRCIESRTTVDECGEDTADRRTVRPERGLMRSTTATTEGTMEQDVVCGMQVDPAKAAAKSEYNGKTYYFCSASCKSKFDANPQQYAK